MITMNLAKRRARRLEPEDVAQALTDARASYLALSEGAGSEADWLVLKGMLAMAARIQKSRIVKILSDDFKRAEQVVAERRFDADTLKIAIRLHEHQLKNLSYGEAIEVLRLAEIDMKK